MTRREQVQALTAEGLTPTQISRKLGISRGIVNRHRLARPKPKPPEREPSWEEVSRRLGELVKRLEEEAGHGGV